MQFYFQFSTDFPSRQSVYRPCMLKVLIKDIISFQGWSTNDFYVLYLNEFKHQYIWVETSNNNHISVYKRIIFYELTIVEACVMFYI